MMRRPVGGGVRHRDGQVIGIIIEYASGGTSFVLINSHTASQPHPPATSANATRASSSATSSAACGGCFAFCFLPFCIIIFVFYVADVQFNLKQILQTHKMY
jgi:hypothetical protein